MKDPECEAGPDSLTSTQTIICIAQTRIKMLRIDQVTAGGWFRSSRNTAIVNQRSSWAHKKGMDIYLLEKMVSVSKFDLQRTHQGRI